jgi:hypothetical protein
MAARRDPQDRDVHVRVFGCLRRDDEEPVPYEARLDILRALDALNESLDIYSQPGERDTLAREVVHDWVRICDAMKVSPITVNRPVESSWMARSIEWLDERR